LHIIIVW